MPVLGDNRFQSGLSALDFREKELKIRGNAVVNAELLRELTLHSRIGIHPHVLTLLGVFRRGELQTPCIITDFVKGVYISVGFVRIQPTSCLHTCRRLLSEALVHPQPFNRSQPVLLAVAVSWRFHGRW